MTGAAVVSLLVALAPTVPVSASESPDQVDESGSVVEKGRFPRPASNKTSLGMWTWLQGRRAYYLTGRDDNGFRNIAAVDLDSGAEVGGAPLDPAGFGHSHEMRVSGQGERATVAVDEAGGRLFVAYHLPPLVPTVTVAVPETDSLSGLNDGSACVIPTQESIGLVLPPRIGCVGGVQVLDARTLERVGPLMPLRVVSVSGAPVAAQLVAMSYSPARGEGDGDKVLLLVMDYAAQGGTTSDTNPRLLAGHSPTFVVQMDVDSGRQDWVVQLDACRGTRDNRNYDVWNNTKFRPHAGAVYRRAGLDDPMVVAACYSGSSQIGTLVRIPLDAAGMPAGLPVAVADPAAAAGEAAGDPSSAAPQTWVAQSAGPMVTVGPDSVWEMIADPASDRVLLKVVAGEGGQLAEVWWVFDVALGQFAGTIGIGPASLSSSNAVLDTERGRLYVLAAAVAGRTAGGLYIGDVRRTPVAQALVFPEHAGSAINWGADQVVNLVVEPPATEGGPARLFVPDNGNYGTAQYRILEDRMPLSVDTPDAGYAGRTLDLDEVAGVTSAAFDGAARGYSVRALLVGGAEAAARLGPVDPVGNVLQCNYNGGYLVTSGANADGTPKGIGPKAPCGSPEETRRGAVVVPGGLLPFLPEGCVTSNPEVVLGFVGPDGANVVDGSGARGGAEPVRVDSATAADLEAPVSRCSGVDWEELGSVPVLGGVALLGSNGVGEPRVSPPWAGRGVECVSSDEQSEASSGDPVGESFAAATACEEEESSGFAYVRGNQVGDVAVGEALSSFRIYRDPARGMVSRVESVARGVNIAGVVRIGMVRGMAESWANGRAFTPPEGEGYDPNCDVERTAGTCFQRQLFGVWTPGYQCGPCGDEQRLLAGLNRALGANGKAVLRDPDPVLARGADNGFIAAITKRNEERFSDLVLNNDLLQTVLPTLEIVRYTAANRVPSGGGPRGRQIYQFAGVEVSSSYGIQCLLVYDEAAGTCAGEAEVPGSITVSLSDPEGEPLAGGAFELRADVDADGVLGLKDTLLPDGACVTADDGVGTCSFENLKPGSYLVSQVAAPPGYAKSSEPWVSEVASGEQRTVAFTNVSNVSMIDMTVTDEHGAPVSGASFAAYPDPDADGKIAPDAEPAATCTTDAAGVCSMQVPAGSYVLVQTGAPGGLEGIEPVAFTFASGGQVAAVTVVNYPPSQPAAPEGAASPEIAYTDPVGYSPPVESIADTYIPGDIAVSPETAGPSVPEQIGGTVVRVIRAPGDALRLLARDPQQAVAFTAALALLVLALLAVRRRQMLGGLTAMPAFAFTGGGTPPAPPRPSGPSAGPGPSGGAPGGSSGGSSGGNPGGRSAPPSGSSPQGSGSAPSTSPASSSGGGGSRVMASTAVLDRPVMGAAPSAMEQVHASVLVATASPVLAAMVTGRLSGADRVTLLAAVDSLEELRATSSRLAPDVLVVDVGLPAGRPGDVYDIVAGLHPADRVVALIPRDAAVETMVTRCLEAGFAGVLAVDGDIGNGHLAYTVRQVAAGKPCYGPTVQKALLDRSRADAVTGVSLSAREREIALLAANGVRRAEIAKRLFLSDGTIKWHLRSIRSKLGVTNPWDRDELRDRLRDSGVLDGTDEQR